MPHIIQVYTQMATMPKAAWWTRSALVP